jgi:hypothetical protein
MDIPLDEVIHIEAISSSSTGAAADADSTPTFAVYEESTDTDIGVGGNMTKRTSLTGDYRASFTASAANGFDVGKWYSVIGSATIGGVATKGVLARFRIVAAEATAGYPVTTHKVGTGTGELNSASGKVPATIAAGDLANESLTAAALKQDLSDELIARLLAYTVPAGNVGEFGNTLLLAANYAVLAASDAATTKTQTTAGAIAAAVWNALTSGLTTVGSIGKLLVDRIDAAITSRAAPGDAMALTSGERSTLVTGIEAELANDATGEALKQAIVDKIIENLPSLDDLTLAAIAAAVRDVSNASPAANSLGADLAAAKSSAATAATQATAGATSAATAATQSTTAATQATTAATQSTMAATQSTAAASSSAAVKVVTDKLATGIEQDGGVYRFTANALEQAPAGGGGGGGGGDATLANQEIIIEDIGALQGSIDALAPAGSLTITNPLTASGELRLVRGDDYKAADGRAIERARSTFIDLTGATILFSVQDMTTGDYPIFESAGSVLVATGTPSFRVELTAAQTAELELGRPRYRYDVVAIDQHSHRVTLIEGSVIVSGQKP